MINTFARLLVSSLSIISFFSAFVVAGDVLIAATVAVAVALAQVVLAWSSQRRVGAMTWASLALVLALTSMTLAGNDVDAATTPAATPVNCIVLHCACSMTIPI